MTKGIKMKISKIYDGKIHGHPLFILSKMLVAFTIVVALTACGGSNTDDGDEAVLKTGVFIDAPVDGVQYTRNGLNPGVTKNGGQFEYLPGEAVKFILAGIELGAVNGAAEVKVTQFANGVLIGQLLQTLDLDPAEDGIDVTGIVIPEPIVTAILERLNAGDQAIDVISQQELADVKIENTQLSFVKDTVVTHAEVIQHVTEQLVVNSTSLAFTESEVENQHYLILPGLAASNFEGTILRFNKDDKKVREISDFTNESQGSYKKWPWSVVDGKVQFIDDRGLCSITKLAEDDIGVDIAYACADGNDNGLAQLLKLRPFSASDVYGKTITVVDKMDEVNTGDFTVTFDADGRYNDSSAGTGDFKNSTTFSNTAIMTQSTVGNVSVFFLASGTLSSGVIGIIDYDESNNFDGVVILETSGNTWTVVFGGGSGSSDSTTSSVSADGVTSGTVNFTDGQVPSDAYMRLVPEAFKQDSGTQTYGDGIRCKIQADGSWGNLECFIDSASNLVAFTQESTYQVIVFNDQNGNSHWDHEESSFCSGGEAAVWNSWESIDCGSTGFSAAVE
jgi:hypothetical protein